jgi:uncharacterized membrane protein YraQ (UPF0718 family)
VASIFVAAGMKLYLDRDAVARFLRRYEKGGVLGATAVAVTTPLCSCGTTALVPGMMAGSMPWAPIVAFMVASPLTSPEELFYSAGLFGWPFAIAFFAASILLGLMGGAAGAILDARGWLRNQARFASTEATCGCGAASAALAVVTPLATAPFGLTMPLTASCGCATVASTGTLFSANRQPALASACGCNALPRLQPIFLVVPDAYGCSAEAAEAVLTAHDLRPCDCAQGRTGALLPTFSDGCDCAAGSETPGRAEAARPKFALMPFLGEVVVTGRRLLVLFLAFTAIGYLINDLVPSAWITSLFGSGHAYSVPLAATLGLPFYINTEASLPLVRGMLNSGMSAGAALAFLITGAGTSIGAVAGAMAIARWRVIALVIGTLWLGAVLCGFAYNALLAAALF